MTDTRLLAGLVFGLVAGFAASAATAHAQEIEKPAVDIAYDKCVARVFEYSDKLSDVFRECEAEMDAFTADLDESMGDKVRQRVMADTQREYRAMMKKKRDTGE